MKVKTRIKGFQVGFTKDGKIFTKPVEETYLIESLFRRIINAIWLQIIWIMSGTVFMLIDYHQKRMLSALALAFSLGISVSVLIDRIILIIKEDK